MIMKNTILFLLILVFTINISCAQKIIINKKEDTATVEIKFLINDEQTAIKIAEVLLFAAYGDRIYKSLPFKAELINNGEVWFVQGTLDKKYDKGGVPFIEFQKKDCKVLKFGHGK